MTEDRFTICPASIWLMGSAVNCRKPKGHDGNHEIKIEWSVGT